MSPCLYLTKAFISTSKEILSNTLSIEFVRHAPFIVLYQVETSNYEEAAEAARAGADVIMLDNFKPDALHSVSRTLKTEFPNVILEASGGITAETFHLFMSDSVDVISQGALTHGYKCLDFSLKVVAGSNIKTS